MAWDTFFAPMLQLKPRSQQIFDQFGYNDDDQYGMGPYPDQNPYQMPDYDFPTQTGIQDMGLQDYRNYIQPPEPPGINPYEDFSFDDLARQKAYDDEFTREMESYVPKNAASQRVDDIISRMPIRQPNTKWQKVLASMYGMKHGPKGAEELLSMGHARRMADWKAELEPAQKAADLERYGNINERQARYQTATMRHRAGTLKVAQDRASAQKAYNDARIEISKKAAEFRGGHWYQDENGYAIFVKPDGTSTRTNVKLINMTPEQKLQWEKDLAFYGITKRAEAARETFKQAEEERRKTFTVQEPVRQRNRIEVKETPGAPTAKPVTAPPLTRPQRLEARQERFREMVADPDHRKWIIPDPASPGDYMMKPWDEIDRTTWGAKNTAALAEDKAHWERVNAYVNGTEQKTTETETEPDVKMRAPDGTVRMIPADKVQEAIRRGAVRIQ